MQMINNDKSRYFRHFKGGLYQLLDKGYDSETCEPVVIYRALYGSRDLWVRPEKMFFEEIERDGVKQPRFQEITEAEYLRLSAK